MVEAKSTISPTPAIIVTDNRPAFSFAANLTFQPEYDPAHLTPALDPSINDVPEPNVKPQEED